MTLRTWEAVETWLAGNPVKPVLTALAGRLTHGGAPGLWIRVGAVPGASRELLRGVMDAVGATLLAAASCDGDAAGDALAALVEALGSPEARTLEWTVIVGLSPADLWPDVSEAVSRWLASLAAVVAASLRPVGREGAHA